MRKEIATYKPTEKDIKLFEDVCELIQTKAYSVKKACEVLKCQSGKFYDVLNSSDITQSKYVRACEIRGFAMAEQTIDIYESVPDVIIVNGQEQQNTIGLQKAKYIAESLKWYASKLNKALSDKPDNTINIGVSGDVVNVSFDGKEGKQE